MKKKRMFKPNRLMKKVGFARKHPIVFGLSSRRIRMMAANTTVGVSRAIRFVSKHPVWSSMVLASTAATILAGLGLRQKVMSR